MPRPTNTGCVNYYYCEACDVSWSDEWDCECDDDCPKCGATYTPESSEWEKETDL